MKENETMNGQPVTESQIAQWAEEAVAGYDVAALKKRGRPRIGAEIAQVAAIRLDPDLNAALSRRAEQDHSTRSEVVRQALQAWLKSA
ncbi:ribbon-helix-helix protein, CopG family [Pseudarthrobacter sp. H2]|uniref:ribbon-helix-helix protein, CopG family n=1 Tax=Pseudarthrobacter sp. H2 TaxID=3418415 RepID=UPI003CEABC6C